MKILVVDSGNLEKREVLIAKLKHLGLKTEVLEFITQKVKNGINIDNISFDEAEKVIISEALKNGNSTIESRVKEIIDINIIQTHSLIGFDNKNHRGKHRTHKNKYPKK